MVAFVKDPDGSHDVVLNQTILQLNLYLPMRTHRKVRIFFFSSLGMNSYNVYQNDSI